MQTQDNYISEAELLTLIKADQLETVIRGNQTNLQNCIMFAQADMESYLNARFDCPTIFSARGQSRHPSLIMYMADIAIYHAYGSVASFKIPPLREARYDAAVQWLTLVNEGRISPAGLPGREDAAEAGSGGLKTGGMPKRDNDF